MTDLWGAWKDGMGNQPAIGTVRGLALVHRPQLLVYIYRLVSCTYLGIIVPHATSISRSLTGTLEEDWGRAEGKGKGGEVAQDTR